MWLLTSDDEILNLENFSRLVVEKYSEKWHVVGYLRNHPTPPREMYESLSGLLECREKARSFLFFLLQAMKRNEVNICVDEIEDKVEEDEKKMGWPCGNTCKTVQGLTETHIVKCIEGPGAIVLRCPPRVEGKGTKEGT